MGSNEKPSQPLPYRTPRQESFPLQPLSRKDTTSTTATSSTFSSTWTSSSTETSNSSSNTNSLATSALRKLRHPRPRSWHQDTPSSRQRQELENALPRQIHQQNLYTDCGRHSNEWLFSGWGDLAKWALGSGGETSRGKQDGGRRGLGQHVEEEEFRGRSERRED